MPYLITTESIVLRNNRFSDSSRYVIVLSKSMGKVTLIAKGSLKPSSRFAACLEPFVHNQVVFYHPENRDAYHISACDIFHPFIELHKNLEKFRFASACVVLIDKIALPNDPNITLFKLLYSILSSLNTANDNEIKILFWAFELKLMTILGYQPNLNHCLKCKKTEATFLKIFLSLDQGGLICEACVTNKKSNVAINRNLLMVLNRFMTNKFNEIKKIPIELNDQIVLDKLLTDYIDYHTELKNRLNPENFF